PPPIDPDEEELLNSIYENVLLNNLHLSMALITSLSSAFLNGPHSGLDADILECLCNPPTSQLSLEDNPDLKAVVKLYLKLSHAQVNYNTIEHLSSVSSLMNDMCVNTCLAFTSPLAALKNCTQCREARYREDILQKSKGKKFVPHQQHPTIPLGPLFQAMSRDPKSADKMHHREQYTQKIFNELCENDGFLKQYSDFLDGSDYLNAVQEGKITDSDIIVMFSINGVQLYQFKASNCWIAIWVIFDHSPKTRYKKKYILPSCIIPGPKKPKNLNLFLFLGFYHLATFQKEGLKIWDTSRNIVYISHPFLALSTADGPGLAYLNGLVGHHRKSGCRLYCGLKGCHKEGIGIYYLALQKPDNYDMAGCDHPDIDRHSI
ncbi:hypothetical protein PAXRUDRAFT_162526, partial [Paxillus rubicundulus Ve08.2h10]